MKNKIIEEIKKLYEKYKKFIWYIFFGVLTMIVNFFTYYIVREVLHIEEVIANSISWFISVTFAYITNKIFVFKSKKDRKREVVKETFDFYASRILTGIVCDVLIFALLVEVLKLNEYIVKLVLQVIVTILNYVMSQFVVFRVKKQNKENNKIKV